MAEQTVTIVATLKDQLTGRLGSIRSNLGKLRTDFQRLGQQVSPIFNQLSLAVAGFASVRGFQAALEAAEQQVQAEKALSFALRGREESLQRILKVTEDIQDASVVDSDDLNLLASRLLAAGVSSADLPRNLQATVDTAAALNIEVEQVGRAIAQFSTEGAGRLGQQVPFLKKLQEDGKLAEQGVQALLDAFGGAALSEAETSFGRVNQRLNQIEDTSERIGKVLVELKSGFLDAALPAAERFAAFLESSEVRNGLKVLASFLPVLIAVASAFTAVGAALTAIKIGLALKGAAIILGSILSTAALVAGQVVFVGAAVAAIVAIVLDIHGLLDDTLLFIDGIVESVAAGTENLRKVIGLVLQGKLTVEDLGNAVQRLFAKIATQIEGFVLNPIRTVFFLVIDGINGIIDLLTSGVSFAILGLVDLTQTSFLGVVRLIAGLIDGLLDSVASAFEKIPGIGADVANSIRTNLAGAIPESFIDIGDDVDKAKADSVAALEGIQNAFTSALADIKAGIIEADEAVIAINKEGSQALQDRLFEVAQDEKRAADAAVLNEKAKNEKIVADAQATFDQLDQLRALDRALITADDLIDISPSQVKELLDGLSADAQEPVRQLLLDEIQDQLAREQLSLNEFLSLRRDIEIGLLEESLQKNTERVESQKELVAQLQAERDAIVAIVESGGDNLQNNQALVELNGRVSEEARTLLALEEQRQAVLLQTIAAERTQGEVKIGLGEAIVAEVQEAREVLASKQAEIADLLNVGELFPTEATSQSKQAVADFVVQLELARLKLLELAATAPESVAQFAEFDVKLDELGENLGEGGPVGTSAGDFFTGISDGAKEAAAQFNDLGAAGVGVGKELVTSFTEGLIDVFIKGNQSFSEFLGNFLQGIAVMLARIAILRAVSAAFGSFGGSEGGEVTSEGIQELAGGGEVHGPNVNRDVINAKLMPKEWVIRKRSTGYYGRGIMSAINRMLIPREVLAPYAGKGHTFANLRSMFAEGGEAAGLALAGSNGSGGSGTPQPAYVFSDEQSLERQLNAGQESFFRMMDRHTGRINATLQRRPT